MSDKTHHCSECFVKERSRHFITRRLREKRAILASQKPRATVWHRDPTGMTNQNRR